MRLTLVHVNGDGAVVTGNDGLAGEDVGQVGALLGGTVDVELVCATVDALVGQDADDLDAVRALAGGVGRAVVVQDGGGVGDVSVVERDGVVAELVQRADELVQGRVGVVVGRPQVLAVIGRVLAGEKLLLAVVDLGDSVGEDGECGGVFGELELLSLGFSVIFLEATHREVTACGCKARVVLVLDEVDQVLGRGARGLHILDHGDESVHLSCGESANDLVVVRVVFQSARVLLVIADELCVTLHDLGHGEDAGALDKGLHVWGFDLLGAVDTDTVDVVRADQVLDPLGQGLADGRVGRLHARGGDALGTKPAVGELPAVLPVVDGAERRVVTGGIEGVEHGVVDVRAVGHGVVSNVVAHLVGHDVDHEVHVALVQLGHEVLEIIGRSKVRVQGVQVLRPVAVVCLTVDGVLFQVLGDGRDLQSSESHALDVVEVVGQTLPGATAVLHGIACPRGAIGAGITVSDDLVDRTGGPFLGAGSERASCKAG